MSRSRNDRYYDDSDDMVERIRRAREAFDKKAKAFQGPDWPHYDKRVIVGKKKKEDVLAAQVQADSAVAPSGTETPPVSSHQNAVPENAAVTTADQTSSWWTAHREAQKASGTADTDDQPATGNHHSDDKASHEIRHSSR
jgi:hypothetical protein